MKILRVIPIALILFLAATPALASVITNALFQGTVRVTENGSGDASAVSVNFTLSSSGLVDSNFANASLTDVAIQLNGADTAFMPSANSSYPWVMWVPSISSGQNIEYDLFTGNVTGGKIRYFPVDGGMTTPDHASLELGDNFAVEQKGWVNTDNGNDKNLVYKSGAFKTYVSETVSGDITSEITAIEWEDLFTSDDWTDVGTKIHVTVGDTRIDYESERSAIDERCWYDLTAVSDTEWKLEYTWRRTASVAGGEFFFGLWSDLGNMNGYADDAVVCMSNATSIRIFRYDEGVSGDSASIAVADGVTVYVTLERTSATAASLSVYSDSARTTHVAGSPKTIVLPATVVDLRYIQASNRNDNNDAAKKVVGWIKDVLYSRAKPVSATGVSSGEHTVKTTMNPALDFDGTDDEVNFSTSACDLGTNDFTIEFWFRHDDTTADYIFTKGTSSKGVTAFVEASKLKTQISDGSPRTEISGAANTDDGEWHLAAITYDRDGDAQIYFDGAADGSAVDITAQSGSISVAKAVYFGRTDAGTADLDGGVDDVRVYTRLLSPTEILEHYESALYADESNLIFHVALNEGVGGAAANTGSQVYNGTIVGATWIFSPLFLFIDGDLEDLGEGASVPDNANDWAFVENNSMPYMESHEITINGAQAQFIEWEFDNVFTDQSANSNDATPTFRSASSDADVSAELVSFEPVTQAEVATFTLGGINDILTGTPDAITQLYTELDFTYMPGSDVVNTILDEGDIPRALWWFPFLFIGIVIVGMLTYGASTLRVSQGRVSSDSAGPGSLLAMCIVIEVLLALFGVMNPIPFWPALLFPIPAIAIIVSQKHWSWG